MRMFGMCLNWKVVAGLAVVGLGIWAVAPNILTAAGPILLVLACPLSMLFMMRGMRGGQGVSGMQGGSCAMQPDQQAPRPVQERRPDDGMRPERVTGAGPMTRVEEIVHLKQEVAHLQARQEALSRELDELDSGAAAPAPAPSALREAQAVAGEADRRSPRRDR